MGEDRHSGVMAESDGSTTRLRMGLLRQGGSVIHPIQGESVVTSRQGESVVTSSQDASVVTSRQNASVVTPRQGLHRQARELLDNPTHFSTSDGVSTRTSSMSEQNQSTNTSENQPSTSSAQSSSTQHESVTDLRHTLADVKLVQDFRLFLRTKFDRNKSGDREYKKMGEQWLDFINICEQVFELPEEDTHLIIDLMVEIGFQFLGKPPDGYNMALQNQLNRKELILHCRALAEKVRTDPDSSLLRDGYEYVYTKLEQKHDIFRKSYRPTTRLAALMCVLS